MFILKGWAIKAETAEMSEKAAMQWQKVLKSLMKDLNWLNCKGWSKKPKKARNLKKVINEKIC